MSSSSGIKGLHHAAYRCRDTRTTREFYEGFLGLPLVDALVISETMTNETTEHARQTRVLHSFFAMEDGSSIAFFEDTDRPFDFKRQHDFDLHIALEVNEKKLHEMFKKGKELGIETRGISDHGFIHSVYFTDPNGYCVELTTPIEGKRADPQKERLEAIKLVEQFALKTTKCRL